MANRIQAIGTYRPRVILGRTVHKKDLVRFIARGTGLNEGEIALVLAELRDAVIYHSRDGRAVKLDGLGTYYPVIRLSGKFGMGHRLDAEIMSELNTPGNFKGQIANRENIGKTVDDLVARWNSNNPGDPVT